MKVCIRLSICIGLCLLILTGCRTTELEDRCFPQVAVVGYDDGKVGFALGFPRVGSSGEEEPQMNEIKVSMAYAKTFADARSKYEGHLNKLVDYNHLKVLVLEEDLLEKPKRYDEMLDALALQEDLPRNTIVCVVDDVEDLLEIDKNLPQDLGTYLEEYLNNHEAQKSRLLTLGDLIDEKANGEMVLYLPYLDVEENYVQWEGYYAVGGEIEFRDNIIMEIE